MQAYRGLPILTSQTPARVSSASGRWTTRARSPSTRARARAIDELVDAGRTPVVAGGTGLYFRAALAELEPASPSPRSSGRGGSGSTTGSGPSARTPSSRARSRAAARLHPNDRRRVVRALELTELGSSLSPARRLWTRRTRLPTVVFGLDVPRDVLEERIVRRARRRCSPRVCDDEVRARWRLGSPHVPSAFDAVAELSRDERSRRSFVRTRRYAAYQRKWLRRIPGLVSVNADRPVDEITHDIVEMASARQRLPAGRTG